MNFDIKMFNIWERGKYENNSILLLFLGTYFSFVERDKISR